MEGREEYLAVMDNAGEAHGMTTERISDFLVWNEESGRAQNLESELEMAVTLNGEEPAVVHYLRSEEVPKENLELDFGDG